MAPMGLSWQIGSGEMSDRKHNKLAATLVRHMRADGMNVTVRDFDGKTRVIATCDGERIEATAVTPYRAAIEVMKLGGVIWKTAWRNQFDSGALVAIRIILSNVPASIFSCGSRQVYDSRGTNKSCSWVVGRIQEHLNWTMIFTQIGWVSPQSHALLTTTRSWEWLCSVMIGRGSKTRQGNN